MKLDRKATFAQTLLHRIFVAGGSVTMTLGCFLVLPVLQAISKTPPPDTVLQSVDTAALPTPDSVIEEEEPEEPEPEEEPPELEEDPQTMDLSQLELILNPGSGDGWMDASFQMKLNVFDGEGGGMDDLFNLADLDQKPRVIYQAQPTITAKIRKKAPGSVTLLFTVDERGKVVDPVVKSSTDPVFDRAALNAIKQWKFEPGKKNGKASKTRIKQTISFPEGL